MIFSLIKDNYKKWGMAIKRHDVNDVKGGIVCLATLRSIFVYDSFDYNICLV